MTLVAVVVPWADIWSVAAGPTRYVVEEQPGHLRAARGRVPEPGRDGDREHRPARHPLLRALPRRRRPLPACASRDLDRDDGLLSASRSRSCGRGTTSPGSPRCPRSASASSLPNADLLWRDAHARGAGRARRRPRRQAERAIGQRDGLDVRRVREHVDRAAALELVAVLVPQHLEVRGERRRVAGDVDDPRRAECAVRRSAFPASPARGGSTTTTSGAPASSTSSSSVWPTLPAKKRAFAMPFSSAFSIAQATASSEISSPHTAAASRASASAIVPVPQ